MKHAILLSLLILPGMSRAAVSLQAGDDAKARFEAVGRPSLLKIKGEGAAVTGKLVVNGDGANGRFEVNVDQFDTGIALRNTHMKEKYLKTGEFPKAILNVKSVNLPAGWAPGKNLDAVAFKGDLTLKGVTKPVKGTVTSKGPSVETEAVFEISLNDFDVGVPSYMGVTVADKVNVTVKIPAFTKIADTADAAAQTPKKTK